MPVSGKRLAAYFYSTAGGNEPVCEWLKDLDAVDRRAIGIDIATVEFGWPAGMPVCRARSGGLWEVRSNLTGGRIARVIFAIEGNEMILLNGFIKETRATPKAELELARSRLKELKR